MPSCLWRVSCLRDRLHSLVPIPILLLCLALRLLASEENWLSVGRTALSVTPHVRCLPSTISSKITVEWLTGAGVSREYRLESATSPQGTTTSRQNSFIVHLETPNLSDISFLDLRVIRNTSQGAALLPIRVPFNPSGSRLILPVTYELRLLYDLNSEGKSVTLYRLVWRALDNQTEQSLARYLVLIYN
ncbi:uncharacterized protein DEA37_0013576, partial [Paragonimus westermani]